ncbi:hypothetical protein [Vibrio ponticus]|uniref:hypothetical protein n=1 Tax=Vibrio ponticus TaxID=265668 RepID=UPI001C84FDB5|nr:hypothetical protein [Vibrio ponticus]
MSLRLLLLCIILCAILAVLPFLNLPILPTNTAFISSYGAYLSWTVAPCIALFAYFGVLKMLKLQRLQLEQFAFDTKKKEIAEALEKLEALIKESLLNHKITILVEGTSYNLYQVMTMLYFETSYQKAVKPKADSCTSVNEGRSFNEVMILESVGTASLYVTRMSEYIREYKKLSTDNLMVGFYYNKYQNLARRLHTLGYLESKAYNFWEQKLNNLFKSDSQRMAFSLCVVLGV